MIDRKVWCRRGWNLTEHEAAIVRGAYLEGTGKGERGFRRRVRGASRRCHGLPINFRSFILVVLPFDVLRAAVGAEHEVSFCVRDVVEQHRRERLVEDEPARGVELV